ncbi:MAG: DUF1904 domain-containing protein [Cetobacterium sp.]|uniref:DUF1904 domain-containing protein n=1 Tax=Cetobacterium sp. TaxID=2071632 RepID=UPI003F395124
MPHLKFRGIEKQILIEHSKELIDGLTSIIQCDRTWFTIEHSETEYIFDGAIVPGYTFIDIAWFDRGQEIKDLVADFITTFFKKITNNNDTTVIFYPLEGNNYYDNGTHF